MIDAVLDTSVLIDLLRGFRPATEWFASLGRQRTALTPYTTNLKHFEPLLAVRAVRPY